MATAVRIGLKDLPAEVVVNIMASIPSPIALLNFLTAFTTVIDLFEKFHSEILYPVFTIEASLTIQQRLANEAEPVSYDAGLACSQDLGRWKVPPLKAFHLEKPHLTLMAIVLECVTGREISEAERFRTELEQRGADMSMCHQYTRYWMFRLVHEEAVAVVSSVLQQPQLRKARA